MRRLAWTLVVIPLVLLMAAPAAAAPRDRRAPAIRFSTTNDDIVVAAPIDHEFTRVRGTATDRNGRGVRSVSVVFCANARRYPEGGYTCGSTWPSVGPPVTRAAAELVCTDRRHRNCRWSTDVPLTPGSYLVIATATDRAGNQRTAGPLFITVV